MLRGFEKISLSQYHKDSLSENYDEYGLPSRSTLGSAGYDFSVLSDYEIEPGAIVKIPTGIKAYMQDDEVLMIFIRSSLGFKYNLRLCNQVGIIDSDYYNNPDNEGHIWVSIKNEGDKTVILKKGDRVVQGIFTKFLKTDNDDNTSAARLGGFGSTDLNQKNII